MQKDNQPEHLVNLKLEGVKLFSFFKSSASWRIRLVLNLKKIPHDIVPVNLFKYEQRTEAYRNINPNGYVPALFVDGTIVTESMAIAEYLEETRRGGEYTNLMPDDPIKKAKIRALCEHVNSGMQPLQNLNVCMKVEKDYGSDWRQWCVYWNTKGFESLEKKLKETAGKFAFGDEPTLADCFIFPQACGSAHRFNIDLTQFPILKRVYDNFLELEEVKNALPKNQADYIKDYTPVQQEEDKKNE